MCDTAESTSEAIKRIISGDSTLKCIDLYDQWYTDEDVTELVDCLLAHPNAVKYVVMNRNLLTDETGIKLARYVAISSTLKAMSLADNQLGNATYLALADALRFNSFLEYLCLACNQAMDEARINCINRAFVDALILNPNRPTDSIWRLYSYNQNEFYRLKTIAEELGHPSMQALLATQLIRII